MSLDMRIQKKNVTESKNKGNAKSRTLSEQKALEFNEEGHWVRIN